MRGRSKPNPDSKTIKRFIGWAENIRKRLKNEEALPASSNFILTQFIRKLCSIHRKQTISDETGEITTCDNHPYLYIALRLAYDIRISVKTNVSMLLREIFVCEGSLQAIFSMLFDVDCRLHISMHTFTLYPKPKCIDKLAFEFFVTSICPLGRDVRETDKTLYTPAVVLNKKFNMRDRPTTPLLAATMFGDPDLVLLLLRHGADPLVCREEDGMFAPQGTPVGFVINTLNIATMMKDSSLLGRFYRGDDRCRYVEETTTKAMLLLTYFLRAVFTLDIRESSQNVHTTCRLADDMVLHFEVQPQVTDVIGLASFRQPPSLRHTCRCVIREVMIGAGREAVPQGVRILPVPSMFKDYLDLLC